MKYRVLASVAAAAAIAFAQPVIYLAQEVGKAAEIFVAFVIFVPEREAV